MNGSIFIGQNNEIVNTLCCTECPIWTYIKQCVKEKKPEHNVIFVTTKLNVNALNEFYKIGRLTSEINIINQYANLTGSNPFNKCHIITYQNKVLLNFQITEKADESDIMNPDIIIIYLDDVSIVPAKDAKEIAESIPAQLQARENEMWNNFKTFINQRISDASNLGLTSTEVGFSESDTKYLDDLDKAGYTFGVDNGKLKIKW